MNNKKNFRIRKSTKVDELVNKSQSLQKALQRIVGGRTTATGTVVMYNRLEGYMEA